MSLDEVLKPLVDSLEKGNFLLAAVIIGVAIAFNYKKLVNHFEERRKARAKKLTDALNCEQIKGLSKSHLEDELASEHFKMATGIGVEKQFREEMIRIHREAEGELGFSHFKRALPHLQYHAGKLVVKLTKGDISGFWFNRVAGIILAFCSLIVLLLPVFFEGASIVEVLGSAGLSIFFMAIALFMLAETFPVVSARKVQDQLEKSYNKARKADGS